MTNLVYDEQIEFLKDIPAAIKVYELGRYPAHYHSDALEIIICLEGSVHLCACYEKRVLSKGSIYSIDPMDPHYIYSDEKAVLLSFYLDVPRLKKSEEIVRGCFFACEDIEINDITIEAMYNIQDIVTSIGFLLTDESLLDESGTIAGYKEIINNYANGIIDYMIQFFDWLSFVPDPYYTNRNFRERFNTIMNYCHANYREKVSVKQLAKMVHINENYLSAFMQKTSFGGFKECINFIRCFMAENLLLTTSQNVIEISSSCGFSDPKYFYAAFRKWWQCSPAQLRKRYKEYGTVPADYRVYTDAKAFDTLKDFMPAYCKRKLINFGRQKSNNIY